METYRIAGNLISEINELENLIGRLKSGEISEAELKAHRVPFGIYEQRNKGTYMVRIRCAAGIITPAQLRCVSDVSKLYASGRLHVTTRQELQIHDVKIENLIPILRLITGAGLSSRGGGGNTVRNIIASWDSGLTEDEVFDVAPHAVELTSRITELHDSWTLPRKYKIAFSSSGSDNSFATVNDLGFIAKMDGSRRGFRVFVAGGMGRMPMPGQLLHEFIPEEEVFTIAEAVKRLFSKYGNRRNKHSARLRFLWNRLGRDSFIEKYEKELAAIKLEKQEPFIVPVWEQKPSQVLSLEPTKDNSEDFIVWKKRFVKAQRQTGLYYVNIPLHLGDISSEQALLLADILEKFGNDVIRFTLDQNISIRNIPERFLGNIFGIVPKVTTLWNSPKLFGNSVACAGAGTCQLGICLSRGLLTAIIDRLSVSEINLDALNDFRIHISGCLNSCGRQGLAHLGFFGKAGHKHSHTYPVYNIVAGAKIDAQNGSVFAKRIAEIAARNVPEFTEEFLNHYLSRMEAFSSFEDYLEVEGTELIRSISEKYSVIPSIEEDESYYRDWGGSGFFSLAGRGTGECAAGLFDLIDIHFAKVRSDLLLIGSEKVENATILYRIVVTTARAILITRGVEEPNDFDVLKAFINEFIETGIVDSKFKPVIEVAQSNPDSLSEVKSSVLAFAKEVENLYSSMDDSLQFHKSETGHDENGQKVGSVDLVKDFRGVACPMNFVKTKMALSQLKPGQILQVFLDDGEPVENVPRSVEAEGHRIVKQEKVDSYWFVIIQKVS